VVHLNYPDNPSLIFVQLESYKYNFARLNKNQSHQKNFIRIFKFIHHMG
jgi:hypothetical protein